MSRDFSGMAERFTACFSDIAATRMAGVPLINPLLSVAVREGGVWPVQDAPHWLAMLVTPWFMNLVLVPAADAVRQIGIGQNIVLPSGDYAARWNRETAVGGFWSVALFSPMFDFADQAAALATADAALAEILAHPEARQVSRRALFRL